MPRKARLEAPGALHHIVVRGIERRKIFRDDSDRDDFLERLSAIKRIFAIYFRQSETSFLIFVFIHSKAERTNFSIFFMLHLPFDCFCFTSVFVSWGVVRT